MCIVLYVFCILSFWLFFDFLFFVFVFCSQQQKTNTEAAAPFSFGEVPSQDAVESIAHDGRIRPGEGVVKSHES